MLLPQVAVEDLVRSVDSLEEVPNATAKEGGSRSWREICHSCQAFDAAL